ncbi:hypothetical protein ACTWPB_04270 [Nocardia sp. IBHARD005]|uniref:hypothetical protein n=1 Tax=Nocardia sp. IBHARD005 TaxID=3457765 RepID=UPI00405840C2
MRSLWFIPQANDFIPADPETGYRGGWVSSICPLTRRQADEISTRGRRRTLELTALLEGAGLHPTGNPREQWTAGQLVGEGFDRWHHADNGRAYHVTRQFQTDIPIENPAAFTERFRQMPPQIVVTVRKQREVGVSVTVSFKPEYGHRAWISMNYVGKIDGFHGLLRVDSDAYFFGWAKPELYWRQRRRTQLSNPQYRADLERKRLGFTGARDFDPHEPHPTGISRTTAEKLVRYYLIGAGVDPEQLRLDLAPTTAGFTARLENAHTELALHIDNGGRITPAPPDDPTSHH